jgi:hypothetical protein
VGAAVVVVVGVVVVVVVGSLGEGAVAPAHPPNRTPGATTTRAATTAHAADEERLPNDIRIRRGGLRGLSPAAAQVIGRRRVEVDVSLTASRDRLENGRDRRRGEGHG